MTITKEMGIMEVVQKYPATVEVFMNSGMGCLGCAAMARSGDEIFQLTQVNVNQFFEFRRCEMNIFY